MSRKYIVVSAQNDGLLEERINKLAEAAFEVDSHTSIYISTPHCGIMHTVIMSRQDYKR